MGAEEGTVSLDTLLIGIVLGACMLSIGWVLRNRIGDGPDLPPVARRHLEIIRDLETGQSELASIEQDQDRVRERLRNVSARQHQIAADRLRALSIEADVQNRRAHP